MKLETILPRLAALVLVVAFVLPAVAGCAFFQPKINGVSIGKYTIVYDFDSIDYNKRAAEYIQTRVKDLTGASLDIVDDGEASGIEHAIVVGETALPISAALDEECEGLEFAISSNGGSIAMEGDYFIIAAAAYYFVRTYIEDADGEATVPAGASVHSPITEQANNVIFLIGDGMGEKQTRLFELYDVPTEGKTAYSDGEDLFYGYLLPYLGASRTESLDGITDSAAGGTALSSGYKTHNGSVGRDGNGNDVLLLTELAISLGKAAAVMSTESTTGATPAAFSSHAADRDDDDDILLSQQAATSELGMIIDCGYDYYSANQMKIMENHIADTLSKVDADEDGFFLMYEEAHIDKHCHNNDADNVFLSVMRFNQAIARFMEYAFYNPDTLVIITADHETGGLDFVDGACTFASEDHTAANVPVFAYGAGTELFDGEEIENTQVAKTIAALMGAQSFGDPATAPALTK